MTFHEAGVDASRLRGVRLRVSYDGGDFHGWQVQSGVRTVAAELASAIAAFAGEPVGLRAVSRTDAGVHAADQVVDFDTNRDWPARAWTHGLNRHLPDDLRVVDACFVAPGSNPRFFAGWKRYVYLLQVGHVEDPRCRRISWFVRGRVVEGAHPSAQPGGAIASGTHTGPRIDLGAMRRAADHLVGRHDFRAFQAANDFRQQTVRRLHAVRIDSDTLLGQPSLTIAVCGNAFLKNMVRILVGTLVDVGRGRRDPDSMPALLGPNARRSDAGQTAPARGLTLAEVGLRRTD